MFNKNIKQTHFDRRMLHCLIGFVLLTTSISSIADEQPTIDIKAASLSFQDQTYLLKAHINYQLSDDAIKALHNGITLTFNVDLSIIEPRKWLWDKHRMSFTLPFQIRYHTLAETYQVSNKTSNLEHNFSSLSTALHALGILSDIPIHALGDSNNISANVSLKAYLNIEALPLPMRPLAYITPGWYLRSNTLQWPLAQ
mgnify:FL=1